MSNRDATQDVELQQVTCQEHGAFGIHPTYRWMFAEGERFDVMCPHGPHYIPAVVKDGAVELVWEVQHSTT